MLIDLRSDTVTRPCAGMREAMANAPVGDDVYGEDPTVKRLQESAATLLGKAAALFVPSGSMANQIALKVHCEPGDDVLVGQGAHVLRYEAGAAAALAGVQLSCIGADGRFDAADVEGAFKYSTEGYLPPTRLLCVENTHNWAGGRVWHPDQTKRVLHCAQQLGLRTHLDGARLLNAAVASGQTAAQLASGFDTVSLCFSKGLGAPVGSVIAGSPDLMARAHRFRKMFGGGMRQAGIIAAGALFALQNNVDRLAQDHENARALATSLSAIPGIVVNMNTVETNIVMADLLASLPSADVFAERLTRAGLLCLPFGPKRLRFVTHRDANAADCARAALIVRDAASDG